MVSAIVATYHRASPEQVASGIAWYPSALDIVTRIADEASADVARVTYALAALSPRNPWLWNVADVYAFAMAARYGRPMPKATTFTRNAQLAWRALHDSREPWTSAAPKVKAFVNAILGDMDSVVVDVWATRVATEGRISAVPTGRYDEVADAYRIAARHLGITPRTVQAVTWLVAQQDGQGSRRNGRHDRHPKRGTHPRIVTMLTGQLSAFDGEEG